MTRDAGPVAREPKALGVEDRLPNSNEDRFPNSNTGLSTSGNPLCDANSKSSVPMGVLKAERGAGGEEESARSNLARGVEKAGERDNVSTADAAWTGDLAGARGGGIACKPSAVANTRCAEPVAPVNKVFEGRRSGGRPEEETAGAEV